MQNKKLWGGRFTSNTQQQVDAFTTSIAFDSRLAEEDILGSLAHVKMLDKCGILTKDESHHIQKGLIQLAQQLNHEQLSFDIADEDIHMNIERLLSEKIGETAGKLHTARSRNDQVALDLHLYLRKKTLAIIEQLTQLQQAFMQQAMANNSVIMPGYTHLQRAQPILFAHHMLAYVAMFSRDIARLQASWPRVNLLPLGAGALAGTGFPIAREYVAELLGFDGLYENSLDAVSDRDFVIEFMAAAALVMAHLSRLSEELIIWSSQEFSFIELNDAYCTGSSMMPQKKNPDVPELIRGKTGRVYGDLFNLLTVLKGLPLAYNKDLQEDKEPLFDTVDTLEACLSILPELIATMRLKPERMLQATEAGFMNATDLADYLATKGLPFRQAHAVVGNIVKVAIEQELSLTDMSLAQLQTHSPLIAEDVYEVLDMRRVVNARQSRGGTNEKQVMRQLAHWEAELEKVGGWLKEKSVVLEKSKLELFTE